MMRFLLILTLASALWIPYAGQVAEMSPAAIINPYAGGPVCTAHNDRAYHGLWNYSLGCHYDHIHGDNPHTVDDIFGTSYLTNAGGDISYPWQTPEENTLKHQTYKWIVRRDLPCPQTQGGDCITAFRAQIHADMFNVVSAYHSFSLEAKVCLNTDPANCGLIRWAGWQYMGDLKIDDLLIYDRLDPPDLPTNQRIEQIHQASLGDPRQVSWYGINPGPARVRVIHRTHDAWGFYPLPAMRPMTDTMTLDSYQFFCQVDITTGIAASDCYSNASKISPDQIFIEPGRIRSTIDADNNFVADYSGYVDRYGAIVSGCTVIGLDCIPVSFEHVPLPWSTYFNFRIPFAESAPQTRDYDLYFVGHPSNWLRFPN